jgi:hypothetical protein
MLTNAVRFEIHQKLLPDRSAVGNRQNRRELKNPFHPNNFGSFGNSGDPGNFLG